MFKNNMNVYATPQRVFALLAYLNKNGTTSDNDLKNKLQPLSLNQETIDFYPEIKRACNELGLLTINDNEISSSTAGKEIGNISQLRFYVNTHLYDITYGTNFYEVTKQIFLLDEIILSKNRLSDSILTLIRPKVSKVNETDMRGWRFWANTLGFGIVDDVNMTFTPNCFLFLKDLICKSTLNPEQSYTITEFFDLLQPNITFVLSSDLNQKNINLGVSFGLRTLHDLGLIDLQYKNDFDDIWFLTRNPGHIIESSITHIVIKEEIYD